MWKDKKKINFLLDICSQSCSEWWMNCAFLNMVRHQMILTFWYFCLSLGKAMVFCRHSISIHNANYYRRVDDKEIAVRKVESMYNKTIQMLCSPIRVNGISPFNGNSDFSIFSTTPKYTRHRIRVIGSKTNKNKCRNWLKYWKWSHSRISWRMSMQAHHHYVWRIKTIFSFLFRLPGI